MTDLERKLVYFINVFGNSHMYTYDDYQMLHGVKYKKKLDDCYLTQIRDKYKNNCYEAAYELKTYYTDNDILSNTIVLKTRPKDGKSEFTSIKVKNELTGEVCEYTHHAIEVFQEHGKFKVLDILHSNNVVYLKEYLDALCKTNDCLASELRYDLGYLVPCHVHSVNMKGLFPLLTYLDKIYCIGKPHLFVMHSDKDTMYLSDDTIINAAYFDNNIERVMDTWYKTYNEVMSIYCSLLYTLAVGINYGWSDFVDYATYILTQPEQLIAMMEHQKVETPFR